VTRSSDPGAGITPRPDARSTVTAATYRSTLALFPTGITVVAARDPLSGQVHGMTANAFMSVSLEPPLVVVSVRTRANLHDRLTAAGRYGVSFLSDCLEQEARRFAGMPVAVDAAEPDFELHSDAPVLSDALAWLVAEVVDAHEAGDHTLFIGHVLDLCAGARPDELPLCFFQASFAQVRPISGEAPILLEPWSHADAWG
jgi:flavin reductase (DIM6/NTAB) family NADH-FMN oxidoreductase RutF